jgi:hypothetical protein
MDGHRTEVSNGSGNRIPPTGRLIVTMHLTWRHGLGQGSGRGRRLGGMNVSGTGGARRGLGRRLARKGLVLSGFIVLFAAGGISLMILTAGPARGKACTVTGLVVDHPTATSAQEAFDDWYGQQTSASLAYLARKDPHHRYAPARGPRHSDFDRHGPNWDWYFAEGRWVEVSVWERPAGIWSVNGVNDCSSMHDDGHGRFVEG